MWFEIYKSGKLVIRGNDIIDDALDWDNELMSVPSLSIHLPVYYIDYISGREEIKIFVNDKCFWGIITGIDVDKDSEIVDLSITHVVHEWTYRQISVNNAVKDKRIQFVFKSKADRVREQNGVSICASNFSCLPTDTNFKTLAKVQAWKEDESVIPLSGITYKLFTRKQEKTTDEPVYTEIQSLPSLDKKDETKEVYVRFYVTSEPGLYVQVQCTVTNDPERDNGEVDITDASVFDQIEDIYGDMNFAYPGWDIDYQDSSGSEFIDYVYSRQNKLDALTRTMELTDDFFWRVGFTNQKLIEIGKFGKRKNWIISKRDTKGSNISLIEDPHIDYDFSNVINVATVYSEKSAGGMNSLTLREVYNDPSLQRSGFPVVILRANVNNERNYSKYITQFPSLAPNNELEYAILDEESIAIEDGHLIEGTFAFNDITAFQEKEDDEGNTIEVTDKDRIEAATSAYKAAVRKLKQARRSYKISLVTEQLPPDINVGDKVRFIYDNSLYELGECSDYIRYLLNYDNWFYITRISYHIDANETETNEVVLEKYLKIDRETKESV
ncbi:MAG: hypothetical protein J6S67_15520 [Methanobrevibacter sp.]|nr:hypothetical protein [Methanobrevibacter sp.]